MANSYKHFNSIIKGSQFAIVYISPQGQILEFNSKAKQLWQCNREDVLSKNFFTKFVMKDDRENLYIDIQKALAGGLAKDAITPITLVNGTEYSLFWSLDSVNVGEKNGHSIIAIAHAIAKKTPTKNDFFLFPNLVYNTNFEDTVNMVLNSLTQIFEKIDNATGIVKNVPLNPPAKELELQNNDQGKNVLHWFSET